MTRLILDTDAGIDDAIAILMALADPNCEVVAIAAVHGNVPVDQVVRNVGTILDAAGAPYIPIFRGAGRPLLGPPVHAHHVHGADGLGDAGFPPSRRRAEPEPAALALLRLARENPGAYTLVTLGPLTNVALALALEPELGRLFREVVTMGGAIRAHGNTTPVAEFNVYADPEAAAMVFSRNLNPTVVPWETSVEAAIPWSQWEVLLQAGPLGARLVAPLCARLRQAQEKLGWREGMVLPDPLALAVALDPALVAQAISASITVETGGTLARGLTALDEVGLSSRPPNARVVTGTDKARFLELLRRTFVQECALA